MVLELLTGGSLRGMLDSGARLSPSQAAHVGRQVTSALEYAHARGVVHRDIKPANLLFDEHGIVRVADFGLARALAEASWTEPAGAVVGTARYAAPEQATGAPLDGRADLYSLAVVLVGVGHRHACPTVADTAIGTLAARARTRRSSRRWSSVASGPVVERAGRPDPAGALSRRRHHARRARRRGARARRRRSRSRSPGSVGEIDTGEPTQIGRRVETCRCSTRTHPTSRAARRRRRAGAGGAGRAAARPARVPLVSVVVLARDRARAGRSAAYALAASTGEHGGGAVARRPRPEAAATERVADGRAHAHIIERTADDPKGTVIAQQPDPGAFVQRRRRRRAGRVARPAAGRGARRHRRGAVDDATRRSRQQGFVRGRSSTVRRDGARRHGRADRCRSVRRRRRARDSIVQAAGERRARAGARCPTSPGKSYDDAAADRSPSQGSR